MKVIIAGFNLDRDLIDRYIPPEMATPEVISAAYARISRSSKSAQQLRSDALNEIPQARTSNQRIVFEMGHSSIAEHAVFNIDLIGISRYLAEFIQRSRLASFTEKSQRYVTFPKDYVVPADLPDEDRLDYISLMDDLFGAYHRSITQLVVGSLSFSDPSVEKIISPSKKDIENRAKEDARYILPLATKTQMGMTINARSMEVLLRRLHSIPLNEAREAYDKLFSAVHSIAPSLIRYTESDEFSSALGVSFHSTLTAGVGSLSFSDPSSDLVRVIDHSPDPDDRILASILYERSSYQFADLLCYVQSLDSQAKTQLSDKVFVGLKAWHKLPRAFEMTDFTMELRMSQCCFAQFKRHRICTMIHQAYQGSGCHILPPQVGELGMSNHWLELLARSDELSQRLYALSPHLAPYCRTNAHSVNVLVRMNLRELYHFVRLRSDVHAQWEIRSISQEISRQVRLICPLTARYLVGKSAFGQID
ncbi:MAG: FAD-dependent thymidylate synthase [Candidatus Cloacimonetes bacterium]|nr:FAD-dependent thymidylate synthase [Candidatus Cloacimonadota bacterium]